MEIVCHVDIRTWRVFVNGASNAMEVGAGIFIITP